MASRWFRAASMVLVGVGGMAQEPRMVTADGFSGRDVLFLGPGAFLGGLALSPEGEAITYDGETGQIRVHGTGDPRVLATFTPPVFGSFLIRRGDSGLVFGESSAGNLYAVPLSGGGAVLEDNIPFCYDMALDGAGRGFVSALVDGSNRIFLADADPLLPDRVIVAGIPGFSGPVAFDGAGALLYGTVLPEGPQKLVRFSPEMLSAAVTGDPIPFESGEVLLDEVPGFFSLKWGGGRLFFTDLGFALGMGALSMIDPEADYLVTAIASFEDPEGILSPGYIAVGEGAGPFAPGAGPDGGRLLVSYANFRNVNRIAEVVPETWFVRGGVNGDDKVDISDAVAILDYLFNGSDGPVVPDSADVNNDAVTDIADPVYLLAHLFQGGPAPPAPFPAPGRDT